MANNKFGNNRGINTHDQEQLSRLGRNEKGSPAEPGPDVKMVPPEMTKPGRKYNRPSVDAQHLQEARRQSTEPHEESTIGADTFESNTADGHVTHKNR